MVIVLMFVLIGITVLAIILERKEKHNKPVIDYCRKCGDKVAGSDAICSTCGFDVTDGHNFCQYCRNGTIEGQIKCTECGSTLLLPQMKPNQLFGVLGFILPVVGLIIYVFMHDSNPGKAKSALNGASLSFIILFIVFLFISSL